ncbi:Nif11-like leader peptide family natural product precursor [Desulforhopalus vacuolatus]|uniref:Nif11-like leader peptide family natural product precursor n=1 Tax=Desulforhopalus vacuolatus TaxID=40414 RepID=UPI0019633AD5|nr:Nif11-like leader peptide family natural product precursor [Desulforhopalus vacuolatus]MBM9518204.1 Nif11-like leader peptide family natural product precursor [Desulforhopalus vacuolatus]
MSKKNVEALLIAGGEDKHLRAKYDVPGTREEFVVLAAADGYDFTIEELDAVLKASGDVFEKNGNPAKRSIWWA